MAPTTAIRKRRAGGRAVGLVRVYDAPARGTTGARVLVDRVWPRGIRKEELKPDRWMREIAPSDELRHWFGHRPERWEEFQRRYRRELAGQAQEQLVEQLADVARRGPLTLLYGTRDEERNQVVVLRQVILERMKSQPTGPGAPASPEG